MRGWHVLGAIGLILIALGSAFAQSEEEGPTSKGEPAEGPGAERRILDEADRLSQEALRLYRAGDPRAAIAPTTEALRMRTEVLGEEHPDTVQSLNNLGRYAEAEPLHQRSLAIKEKALGPEHPAVATSLNSLALLYQAQGKYAEAERLFERSLAIWEKALGPEHPKVATSLENYAALLRKAGRITEADRLDARAKTIRAKRAR